MNSAGGAENGGGGGNNGEGRGLSRAEIGFAAIGGVVFVVAMLVIAIAIPNPTEFQIFVFRVVLALAAAACAGALTGFLHIDAAFLRWTVRAGGGLAVFLVIYRLNPPSLITQPITLPVVTSVAAYTDDEGNHTIQLEWTRASGAAGVAFFELFNCELGPDHADAKRFELPGGQQSTQIPVEADEFPEDPCYRVSLQLLDGTSKATEVSNLPVRQGSS